MPFPAFLDTNVLYSATLRDTLLRIAGEGAVRPEWSEGVLKELDAALVGRAGLTTAKTTRLIDNMRRAFPLAEVLDSDPLIEAMTCDRKDRHVLAAAVAGSAQALVTFNTKGSREAPPPT